MAIHPRIAEVTERIRQRSSATRGIYLEGLREAVGKSPKRVALSCSNLAHGFAACDQHDKDSLKGEAKVNIAIVSSYNDMLSAHQPLERFPALIKKTLRQVG